MKAVLIVALILTASHPDKRPAPKPVHHYAKECPTGEDVGYWRADRIIRNSQCWEWV